MKTKWFIINKRTKTFCSLKMAGTLAQAWEKTIEKWKLIRDGYIPADAAPTCGLCNLYIPYCKNCPIRIVTRGTGCQNTPYLKWCEFNSKANAIAELKFLKDVKKKTYRKK